MTRLKAPEKEFEQLARRSLSGYVKPFDAMAMAIIDGKPRELETARQDLADVIAPTMTLADLTGRRRLWLEFDAADVKPEDFFISENPIVPALTFEEAFADILRREPRLAGTAQEVANLYRTRHAFALVKSAEKELTQAVQRAVGRLFDAGVSVPEAGQVIADMGGFTKAYGRVVYRTNMATAYNAGREQQAKEPGVRVALPAMERWSVTDSSVRRGREEDGPKNGVKENHLAGHGVLMESVDPRRKDFPAPAGWACRCGWRMVSVGELKRRGLLEGNKVTPVIPSGSNKFQANPHFVRVSPGEKVYGGGAMV